LEALLDNKDKQLKLMTNISALAKKDATEAIVSVANTIIR